MVNKNLKRKIKKKKGIIDYNMAIEMNLVMENEHDEYKKESWLAENYAKKYKKGKFDFNKAQKGVNNQLVTPFARKYQNDWGVKVPNDVREAVSKARMRAIMNRIRDGDFA